MYYIVYIVITCTDDPEKVCRLKGSSAKQHKALSTICVLPLYSDWSKNEYFNCTSDPRDNPSVERCGVPFSCCLSGGMNEGLVNIMCGFGVQEMSKVEVISKVR